MNEHRDSTRTPKARQQARERRQERNFKRHTHAAIVRDERLHRIERFAEVREANTCLPPEDRT